MRSEWYSIATRILISSLFPCSVTKPRRYSGPFIFATYTNYNSSDGFTDFGLGAARHGICFLEVSQHIVSWVKTSGACSSALGMELSSIIGVSGHFSYEYIALCLLGVLLYLPL